MYARIIIRMRRTYVCMYLPYKHSASVNPKRMRYRKQQSNGKWYKRHEVEGCRPSRRVASPRFQTRIMNTADNQHTRLSLLLLTICVHYYAIVQDQARVGNSLYSERTLNWKRYIDYIDVDVRKTLGRLLGGRTEILENKWVPIIIIYCPYPGFFWMCPFYFI